MEMCRCGRGSMLGDRVGGKAQPKTGGTSSLLNESKEMLSALRHCCKQRQRRCES